MLMLENGPEIVYLSKTRFVSVVGFRLFGPSGISRNVIFPTISHSFILKFVFHFLNHTKYFSLSVSHESSDSSKEASNSKGNIATGSGYD